MSSLSHANKQLELLNASKLLEKTASEFLYLSMRIDGPEVDKSLQNKIGMVITAVQSYRVGVTLPNLPDEGKTDDQDHPFDNSSHKKCGG